MNLTFKLKPQLTTICNETRVRDLKHLTEFPAIVVKNKTLCYPMKTVVTRDTSPCSFVSGLYVNFKMAATAARSLQRFARSPAFISVSLS